MTTKKFHHLLMASIILLILLIGLVVYFGRNIMISSSDKVVNAKLEIIRTQKAEDTYIKNKNIYLQNEDLANKLNQLVPTDKEEVSAIESIYAFAEEANINVPAITFPGSNLDPNIKSKNKVDISQATPLKGLNNVYYVPIEVTLRPKSGENIAANDLLQLIESIESSPRNMRITAITYDSSGDDVKLNIWLFVKKANNG